MTKSLSFVLAASFTAFYVTHASVLITGVYDGPLTGGKPKGIELFVSADIADLSLYGIGFANNGEGSDGQEFTLSGSAEAGDFLYIASESTEFSNFFGFLPDFTSGLAAINGDDAVELFFDGGVIDVFGDVDVNGNGEVWDYMDGWAYRKSATVVSTAFNLSDWTFSGINVFDNEASNTLSATPIPLGTYVIPEPSSFPILTGLASIALAICNRRRYRA